MVNETRGNRAYVAANIARSKPDKFLSRWNRIQQRKIGSLESVASERQLRANGFTVLGDYAYRNTVRNGKIEYHLDYSDRKYHLKTKFS